MKIIADDKIPFLQGVLEPYAKIKYCPGKEITNDVVKDADALLIRTRTKCDEKLLKNSSVKFIATATIGFDHIDAEYCRKAGIEWANAPGCNSSSVMQYVASALVTLSQKKRIDFNDMALGVVGVGNVGSKVVRLAEELGIKVYLNDPPLQRKRGPCRFISLDGILRECNIISFHVPLNMNGEDKTFHLADRDLLNRVIPGSLIINSSRGEVVDTQALKEALKSGHLAGAILDVWENEPSIDRELLELADIASPHIAGYSADGKANGTKISVRSLSKFFNLGIDDWSPESIPEPQNSLISINCARKDDNDIVHECILATYNIMEDDRRLRNSVETFEKQRGSYPLRREFHAYEVKLSESIPEVEERLKKLGFKLKSTE